MTAEDMDMQLVNFQASKKGENAEAFKELAKNMK